jgi:hypothetical protein
MLLHSAGVGASCCAPVCPAGAARRFASMPVCGTLHTTALRHGNLTISAAAAARAFLSI